MIEHLKGIHETVDYKENTNIRLYDNNKNEDYPIHWHTPIEIIMPIDGNYTVIVGDTVKELHCSDILFICPGVIHSLKAPQKGRRIIFQAEINMLRQIKEIENVLTLLSPAMVITSNDSPELHALLQKKFFDILSKYNTNHASSELGIYATLLEMFVYLDQMSPVSSTSFNLNHQMQKEYIEKFVHICNYINAHCTEDLSLDEIANLAGFSKYYFTRLFKQFTNTTFYKYLTQKRIAHAEQLLIDPALSITEVALQSGFSNQSAFIRMFKLIKSCTPTEFRSMYSKC